jgi:hypothetical protein
MARDTYNAEPISVDIPPSLIPELDVPNPVKWSEYRRHFIFNYPVPQNRDRGIRDPYVLSRDFAFPNTTVMIIPLEASRGQAVFLNDYAGMTVIPAAHFDRAGNMLWLPIQGLVRSTREDLMFPYQVDPHPWKIRSRDDFYKVAKAWSVMHLDYQPRQRM